MKKINYYLFIMIITIALCQDGGGYRFVNTTKSFTMDIQTINESHFGPFDIFVSFSGNSEFDHVATDEKTGQITRLQSWSNIIATTRVNEKVKPNHFAQKQNGTSYLILQNANGKM